MYTAYLNPSNADKPPAIPLFVTFFLVSFLAVTLNVVRSDTAPYKRLKYKKAASYVFSAI
jgi:hypothetical protein